MERLYLHVGLSKSGTTYLQRTWRVNADELARQGVWVPAGPGDPVTRLAVWDLVGRRPRGTSDARIAGQWQALTHAVRTRAGQQVLLSEEYLAARAPRQAEHAVAGFADHEVHVVVTARDLGRVLVSSWQEDVKSGGTATWRDFVDAVRDPARTTRDPARGFWRRQDLARVLTVWAGVVGAARVHVVTVPPQGAPPQLLLERVGRVIGYDARSLSQAAEPANACLAGPDIEVLRRLNELIAGRLNQRQYDWVVKHTLETSLPSASGGHRLVLSPEHLDWARREAERMVGAVRTAGVDVVGDLADLLPVADVRGRVPGEVAEGEVLDASLRALAVLVERAGTGWWLRRRPDQPAVSTQSGVLAASAARGFGYRLRRRGAEAADTNAVASAAMALYLRGLPGRAPRVPRQRGPRPG